MPIHVQPIAGTTASDPSSAPLAFDSGKVAELRRIQIIATGLLILSLVIVVVAKIFEQTHWSLGYVAAWAEAATIGGLADWYAVVALFKHPLGIPIPHTAIIPRNQNRIAESFGSFIEEHFLAPEPIGRQLSEIDFAAMITDWLSDNERSRSLSKFCLRLLPQALAAIDETGLRSFLTSRMLERLEALELAPIASELLRTMVEGNRHQIVLDQILSGLSEFLGNQQTLDAVQDKIRRDLPSLFSLFRADAYVTRKLLDSIGSFIEEVRADPAHPLRHEFNQFVMSFIEKLHSSKEYADKAETLKATILARPEIGAIANDLWQSLKEFCERDVISPNSLLETNLANILVDIGGKLADEPQLRIDINHGIVLVLLAFTQTQKHGIALFISEQIKSWNAQQMTRLIEVNIGRDLQYIRLNGTLIGGLAGVCLHFGEQILRLH